MSWFDTDRYSKRRTDQGTNWGAKVEVFDTLPSTNDTALEAVREGAASGTVWVTREQTSGRGRRGNTWTASPGECLTLSTLFLYEGEPERLMGLSLVIGLALRDAIESRLESSEGKPRATIKWPNDVYVEDKKLAGILVETRSAPDGQLGIVMGVGINVHTTAFPKALPDATSLAAIGVSEDRRRLEDLLADFLSALEQKCSAFFRQDFSPFLPEMVEADFLHGKRIRVGETEGVASGFDTAGRLLVSDEKGQVSPVLSGTVELCD